MNTVKYRAYVKGAFVAKSSFMINGNANWSYDETDMVVLRDQNDEPFLPGSSLAGVLRNIFEESESTELLFGPKIKKDENLRQSNVITYDCFLSEGCKPKISFRDGIRLKNDSKTTDNNAKYDYEAVEPGASFDFKLEIVIRKSIFEDSKRFNEIMKLFKCLIEQMEKGVYLGAKTNRGFGHFVLEKPLICEIEGSKAYELYVGFDWDKSKFIEPDKMTFKDSFSGEEALSIIKAPKLKRVHIKFTATTLIRNYIGKDVEMLRVEGKPIIPGTSWNGLFRHGCRRILLALSCSESQAEKLLDSMFGTNAVSKIAHDEKAASKVAFSETTITGCKEFKQTNVKIDRFTQGAAEGALFDAGVVALGETDLDIRYTEEWMWDLLCLVLADLNDGLVAIGGQTSIGRGLCETDAKPGDCRELVKKLAEEGLK